MLDTTRKEIMALQCDIMNPYTGEIAVDSYNCIDDYGYNKKTKAMRYCIESYRSKEERDERVQPFVQNTPEISAEEFDTYFADDVVKQDGKTAIERAYTHAKLSKIVDEVETNKFADSTDV